MMPAIELPEVLLGGAADARIELVLVVIEHRLHRPVGQRHRVHLELERQGRERAALRGDDDAPGVGARGLRLRDGDVNPHRAVLVGRDLEGIRRPRRRHLDGNEGVREVPGPRPARRRARSPAERARAGAGAPQDVEVMLHEALDGPPHEARGIVRAGGVRERGAAGAREARENPRSRRRGPRRRRARQSGRPRSRRAGRRASPAAPGTRPGCRCRRRRGALPRPDQSSRRRRWPTPRGRRARRAAGRRGRGRRRGGGCFAWAGASPARGASRNAKWRNRLESWAVRVPSITSSVRRSEGSRDRGISPERSSPAPRLVRVRACLRSSRSTTIPGC